MCMSFHPQNIEIELPHYEPKREVVSRTRKVGEKMVMFYWQCLRSHAVYDVDNPLIDISPV